MTSRSDRAELLAACARFIAAAPDLLAACEAMTEHHPSCPDSLRDTGARCDCGFSLARAAIAKARGES